MIYSTKIHCGSCGGDNESGRCIKKAANGTLGTKARHGGGFDTLYTGCKLNVEKVGGRNKKEGKKVADIELFNKPK